MVGNKKGAISLAVNLIVVVIISIVILTSGLLLLRSFIGGAEDLKANLDRQTENELDRLLISEGKKVALPLHTVSVEAGDSHVFGVGILNLDAGQYGDEFSMQAQFHRFIDTSGAEATAGMQVDPNQWLLYDPGPFPLVQSANRKEGIQILPPEEAPKGQYIFNVEVYDQFGRRYDSIKKFYVTVI